MKKYLLLIAAIMTCFLMLSCKGETGPAGASGIPGTDGKALYVKMFQAGVYPDSSYVGMQDSTINSNSADYNYGTCDGIYSARLNSSNATARLLIQFSVLDDFIPANSTITKAQLVFYCVNVITYTASDIQAYTLTQNWTEGTACGDTGVVSWNTYSGSSLWTTPGGDYDATPVSDAVMVNTYPAYHILTLNSETVANWIKSPGSNHGILIKLTDETKDAAILVFSKEKLNSLYRPKLVVYYTIP